jgi:hypothetical protein
MKKIFLMALLFCTHDLFAQKGLDEMIATEKAFAAYSVSNGAKDAFLKFMDTTAVMFEKGEKINGYQRWLNREKRPGVLNWRPRYAEMAGSGDYGYTCGPWTFQPTSITDSIVGNGYFFTIWHRNNAGEWKFILDVGVESAPMMNETSVTRVTTEKSKGTEHTLREAEEAFQRQYKLDEGKAYKEFMSADVIIASEKKPLINGYINWKYAASPEGGKIEFSYQGGGIAPSSDLGHAYGSATLNGKKETYLRIWRHELTGWKIALQLIKL